eukprot:TRINITY_DN1799_c0_g1_i1.p1 TRINITY_DN1799_c0_g1~~TRINITY_DN1799_c0_g1_i1.p1  ORF type:complete len:306 (-),score=74.81 TRINITY_DN1799_c0_g1_i1:225-1142(-)
MQGNEKGVLLVALCFMVAMSCWYLFKDGVTIKVKISWPETPEVHQHFISEENQQQREPKEEETEERMEELKEEAQNLEKPVLCGVCYGRHNQEIEIFYKNNNQTLDRFKLMLFVHSLNDNLKPVKYSHNTEYLFLNKNVTYYDLSHKLARGLEYFRDNNHKHNCTYFVRMDMDIYINDTLFEIIVVNNPSLHTNKSLYAGHLWGAHNRPHMSGNLVVMNLNFVKKVNTTRYSDDNGIWKHDDLWLGWNAHDVDDIFYYDMGVYFFGSGYPKNFNNDCWWLVKHKWPQLGSDPWNSCVFRWSKPLL